MTVLAGGASALSGNLSARVPVRALLAIGLALVGVGLLLMHGLTSSSGWTALLPGFLLAGAGIGLVNPALASTAVGVVPPQRSGMASGINNTFRQVGIATGIAALGALFQSAIARKLGPALAHTAAAGQVSSISHAVAAGGTATVLSHVPPAERPFAAHAIHVAFVGAMNELFIVAAVVALVGAAAGLVLVRKRDFIAVQHGARSGAGSGLSDAWGGPEPLSPARPGRRQSSKCPENSANTAPCGSAITAILPTPMSSGPPIVEPPELAGLGDRRVDVVGAEVDEPVRGRSGRRGHGSRRCSSRPSS